MGGLLLFLFGNCQNLQLINFKWREKEIQISNRGFPPLQIICILIYTRSSIYCVYIFVTEERCRDVARYLLSYPPHLASLKIEPDLPVRSVVGGVFGTPVGRRINLEAVYFQRAYLLVDTSTGVGVKRVFRVAQVWPKAKALAIVTQGIDKGDPSPSWLVPDGCTWLYGEGNEAIGKSGCQAGLQAAVETSGVCEY